MAPYNMHVGVARAGDAMTSIPTCYFHPRRGMALVGIAARRNATCMGWSTSIVNQVNVRDIARPIAIIAISR